MHVADVIAVSYTHAEAYALIIMETLACPYLAMLCLLALAYCASGVAGDTMKTPAVFDTDIGYEDDVMAITLALTSSELDVKLVVTSTGDITARAKVVAKMLTILGRDDIPIGLGIKNSNVTVHPILDWAKDFDLSEYKGGIFEDGVGKMGEVILSSTSIVEIFMIAPVINFPSLLERFPGVITKARARVSGGSIFKGYDNSSAQVAEYNIGVCPWCFSQVLNAGWPITLAPLDTTGLVSLQPSQNREMLTTLTPSVNVVAATVLYYCTGDPFGATECNFNVTTPVFYDAVTTVVALTEAEEFIVFSELKITVNSTGFTNIDNNVGVPVSVALDWMNGVEGLDGFREFLVDQLTSISENSGSTTLLHSLCMLLVVAVYGLDVI